MAYYKTSVIIPVYNTEQYLDECIRSVLNQTQRETELILIDDGSTDKSYEIMCSYAAHYSNIKVFHQGNKKLGAARNFGMKHATGKYIFFLDSDDYIEQSCLEELFNCAEENHLDFVTYDSEVFVEQMKEKKNYSVYDRSMLGIKNKVYCGWDFLNIYYKLGGVFVSACLGYYNAEFLRRNQILFEEQVYYEDNEFSLKVYYYAKQMMCLTRKLYIRRYRENSIMTSAYGIDHIQSAFRINQKCLQLLLKVSETVENMEGIREIISTLTHRIIDQLQTCKNDSELYHNSYIRTFYDYFIICDENALFSNLGLGLAFDYYSIFSMIMEKGYLNGIADTNNILADRLALLRREIKRVIDNLLEEWEVTETSEKYIVVYGTGDIAERITNCYRSIYRKPDMTGSKIIFATTKIAGERYKEGIPIVQLDQIGRYPISVILVASTKYEGEMCAVLNRLYDKKFAYVTYRVLANVAIGGKE